MRQLARCAAVGWILLVLLTMGGRPAWASTGVAVDVGRIDLVNEVRPGASCTLPTIGITNPGTQLARYRMVVSSIGNKLEARAPSSWFEFSESEFSLEPGATEPVSITLRVPPGARPGDYQALVGAQLAGIRQGASVAGGAAARLSFVVAPAGPFQAWLLKLWTLLLELAPWSYLLPIGVLLVVGGRKIRRAFTIRVERRA